MADEPAKPRTGGAIPKVRDDDARGTPTGLGTVTPLHGGQIGNPAHIPTDEMRARVKAMSQTFTEQSKNLMARKLGISVSTLSRHYLAEMEEGRAELVMQCAAIMIGIAVGKKEPVSKAQMDACKFILARQGKWTERSEVTGPDGGPIKHAGVSFDLSHLDDSQVEAAMLLVAPLLGE